MEEVRSFHYWLLILICWLELDSMDCYGSRQFSAPNLQELEEEDESLDDESDKEKDIKPENKVSQSMFCLLLVVVI